MGKDIIVKAQIRDGLGTTEANRMRNKGLLPCAVSTIDSGSKSLTVNAHDFERMMINHSSESLVVDLEIDGDKAAKVLLKEIQHNTVTGKIVHVDFVEISMTEKMTVEVAIELQGDPIGVTQGGGILEHLLRNVEISCLPSDLVEFIDVDVTELALSETLFVRDMTAPKGVEIVTDGTVAIAAIAVPRVEDAEEDAEAAPAETGTEAPAEENVKGAEEK